MTPAAPANNLQLKHIKILLCQQSVCHVVFIERGASILASSDANVYNHLILVDGGWDEWSEWICSAGCGGGYQYRFRYCESPMPQYGGKPCVGNDTMLGNTSEVCNNQTCEGW